MKLKRILLAGCLIAAFSLSTVACGKSGSQDGEITAELSADDSMALMADSTAAMYDAIAAAGLASAEPWEVANVKVTEPEVGYLFTGEIYKNDELLMNLILSEKKDELFMVSFGGSPDIEWDDFTAIACDVLYAMDEEITSPDAAMEMMDRLQIESTVVADGWIFTYAKSDTGQLVSAVKQF